MSEWDNFTTSPEWSKGDFSIENLTKGMEAARKVREEMLRSQAAACNSVKCNKCGCQASFTNAGFGDTLELCSTLYAALKRQAEVRVGGVVPFGSLAVRVKPCDVDFPEMPGEFVLPAHGAEGEK